MKQRATRWKEWLVGGVLLAGTLSWCVAAGRVLYYAGDYMVGFHLLLLPLLPYAGTLGLATIVGCVMQKWRFAAVAAVSFLAVCVFLTQGYRIELWAWSKSIRQFNGINQDVIDRSAAVPELTDETLRENLWNDEALPVLDGFTWYCKHHLASPGGTFRAFRYRGAVHVRIQKIRHGYRGIARVSAPGIIQGMEKGGQLVYASQVPIGGHWVIWRTSLPFDTPRR
jgi:hypothetical protein